MSKKKLFLIPALLLALTSCGGPTTSGDTTTGGTDTTTTTDPTTSNDPTTTVDKVVTGIEITNKETLREAWTVGQADRSIVYAISYSDGTTSARGATITSSDTAVVSILGSKAHAVGAGSATITVTAETFTDTVDVSVVEAVKEKTVTVTQLIDEEPSTSTAFIVTGVITKWNGTSTDAGDYGNFYIADPANAESEILVYGATEVAESLKWDEATQSWSWTNPNSSSYEGTQTPFPKANYKIGDTVTMKGLRLDYNTTKEFEGIITDHQQPAKVPVTKLELSKSVDSIGNGYSYMFEAKDDNQDSDLVKWEVVSGDAATITEAGLLTADKTKTGEVTLKVTSTSNAEVSLTDIKVTITTVPEIVEAASLQEVINDESGNGAKLFKVTAKTVANEATSAEDKYGNFDYVDPTDPTIKITSYGLSKGASSITNYYNGAFKFSNLKNFADTGVEVGSENEYTVVVMRSDYKGTKQLVGYLYEEGEDPNPDKVREYTVSEALQQGSLFGSKDNSSEYLFKVTGLWNPTGSETDAYGNGFLIDETTKEEIKIYGFNKDNTSITQLDTGLYKFSNKKDYQQLVTDGIEKGDKVTIAAVPYKFGETLQLMGYLEGDAIDTRTLTNYSLTISAAENGTITPVKSEGLYVGEQVEVDVAPASGYKVGTALFNDTNVATDIVDGKLTLTVDFENRLDITFVDETADTTATSFELSTDAVNTIGSTYIAKDLSTPEGTLKLSSGNWGKLGDRTGFNLGTNKSSEADALTSGSAALPKEILSAVTGTTVETAAIKVGDLHYYGIYSEFNVKDIASFNVTSPTYISGASTGYFLVSKDDGATWEVLKTFDAVNGGVSFTAETAVDGNARFAYVVAGASARIRLPIDALTINK